MRAARSGSACVVTDRRSSAEASHLLRAAPERGAAGRAKVAGVCSFCSRKPARAREDKDRSHLSLTVPRLRTLRHGSRCILDRLSAFLSQDIDSVLKGGVKVCQRPLVNEVLGPFFTDFDFNVACKDAYSVRLPQPPSRLHLGRQTHQT